MKKFYLITALLLLLCTISASAEYISIGKEVEKYRVLGGVVFSITNNMQANLTSVRGWVYGYKDKKPYKFIEVSNPNIEAQKLTPGPHKPGKDALYLFRIPPHHSRMEKYGVVVYDAPLRFSK